MRSLRQGDALRGLGRSALGGRHVEEGIGSIVHGSGQDGTEGIMSDRANGFAALTADLVDTERAPSRRFERTRFPRPKHIGVSCVIPAMNEGRNIAWVLERLPDPVDEVIL